jgi:hypothetical protein
LDGVVSLAERAEDPVGDRPQAWSLTIEPVGEREVVHLSHPAVVGGHTYETPVTNTM